MLFAQQELLAKGLFSSQEDKFLFEIHSIVFEGNETFPDNDLMKVISSRPSNQSSIRQLLLLYYKEGKKNKNMPVSILNALKSNLKLFEGELKYFKSKVIENDIESLEKYYSLNGFHFAKVSYEFVPDSTNKQNILKFIIKEDRRFTLTSLVYLGLDKLDPIVKEQINTVMQLKTGSYFSEGAIVYESSLISAILQNNGYFYSYRNSATVTQDTNLLEDSVTIEYYTGKRVKISKLLFKDSTDSQKIVADAMKQEHLQFRVGQWYSKQSINKSISNMNALNIFSQVYIDTISLANYPNTDSTINLQVKVHYAKQQDFGAGLFLNTTAYDNLQNLGFEAEYTYRNIFGAAEIFHPYLNASIKDPQKWINGELVQYEYQVGTTFSQPLMMTIDNARIGASLGLSFSRRSINNVFLLDQFILPQIRFPIDFGTYTFFNNALFELTVEKQKPIGFQEGIKKLTGTGATNKVMESLALYNSLDKNSDQISSLIISFSLMGDSRNHPFSPTSGSYTSINLDGALPLFLTKFLKFQFSSLNFMPINNEFTFASKFKFGTIYSGGYNSDNNYIPLERQFFTGGANSVRGWESRKLRFTNLKPDSISSYTFYEDFLGSSTFIDASLEIRYRFARPDNIDEGLAEKIASMGFTFFIDFGNSYSWYLPNDKTNVDFADYITKLAIATGLGFRFETPIGPVRLDAAVPLYGPIDRAEYSSIFDRNNILGKDMKIHIGIGHAF